MSGYVWGEARPTTTSLYFNVVLTLFVLTVLNTGIRRLRPQWALSHGELLVVYAMLAIASALAGLDQIQTLTPLIGHATWHATPENGWEDLFLGRLPSWLTVSDKTALKHYYDGDSSLYLPSNLHPWLVPVAAWSAFIVIQGIAMLSINSLIRRNWTEEAKLSFPIIELPVEMTSPRTGFMRSPWMWGGFLLAAAYDIMNGLHFLYPIVPGLGGTRLDLQQYLLNRPWNAIGWTPVVIYPFAVGLGFLIPLDLAFSCWFFYLFWKIERVIGEMSGWRTVPDFPFIEEQEFGAYIALSVACLWIGRKHLWRALRSIWRHDVRLEDAKEPLPYRWALYLGLACFVGLMLFLNAAGASVWLAATYLAAYLLIAIGITRVRAELGTPVHDLHFAGPDRMLPRIFGTASIGKRNLIMLTFMFFQNRAQRSHPMPNQLEGFKLAEQTDQRYSKWFGAMAIAIPLGTIFAFWAILHLFYLHGSCGAATGKGYEAFNRLQSWLTSPRQTDWPAVGAMTMGLLFTFLLMAARLRFSWWPFHPAGFAVSGSWSINLFWLSILVAWLIKTVLLHYGGMKSYRPASRFFMGLILGEFLAGSFWNILGCITHRPMYNYLP